MGACLPGTRRSDVRLVSDQRLFGSSEELAASKTSTGTFLGFVRYHEVAMILTTITPRLLRWREGVNSLPDRLLT